MKALFLLLVLFLSANTHSAVAQVISSEKTTLYYPNGAKKAEGNMIGNKRVGAWKIYYESGQVKASGSYKEGEKDGEWETFHDNGKVESKGGYKGGKKVGVWKEYNTLGIEINKKDYQ